MTKIIIKQMSIFPTVTKDQAYRLTKSYLGSLNRDKFGMEFNYLVSKGIIVFDGKEYRLAERRE